MGEVKDTNTKSDVQNNTSAKPTPADNTPGGDQVSQSSNNYTTKKNSSSSSSGGGGGNGNLYNHPDNLGTGHTKVLNPLQSTGEFLGLQSQKNAAEAHTLNRIADSGGLMDERIKNGTLEETCETEDHSFMGRKPGPETLLGSSMLKDAVDRLTK